MVSAAAGMARHGLLPVVNSFASFLASRANEQIYNQASERSKVVYALHYAGLIPAGPGKSHQSVRDASLLAALPGMTVVHPANAEETRAVVRWAVEEAEDSVAIRLAIGPSPRRIELGEGWTLVPGQGTRRSSRATRRSSLAYGPVMLHEALGAAEILARAGNARHASSTCRGCTRVDPGWLEASPARIRACSSSRITRRSARSATPCGALLARHGRCAVDVVGGRGLAGVRHAARGAPRTRARRARRSRAGSTGLASTSLAMSRAGSRLARPAGPALDPGLRRHRASLAALAERARRRARHGPRSTVEEARSLWGDRLPVRPRSPRAPRAADVSLAEKVTRRTRRRPRPTPRVLPARDPLQHRHGFHLERMEPGHPNRFLDTRLDRPASALGPASTRRWGGWYFSSRRYVPSALRRAPGGGLPAARPLEHPDQRAPAASSPRRGDSGLPTVGYVASWDHTVGKGVMSPRLDRYVVQNEIMRDDLVRYHGIEGDRVVVTGWPQSDAFHRAAAARALRRAPRRLRARPGSADVVLVTGNTPTNAPVRGALRRAPRRAGGRSTAADRLVARCSARTRATALARALRGGARPTRASACRSRATRTWTTSRRCSSTSRWSSQRGHDPARRARQRSARSSASSTTRAHLPGEHGLRRTSSASTTGSFSPRTRSLSLARFDDVVTAIEDALARPTRPAEARGRVTHEVLGEVDGGAVERVVDALLEPLP